MFGKRKEDKQLEAFAVITTMALCAQEEKNRKRQQQQSVSQANKQVIMTELASIKAEVDALIEFVETL